MFRTRLKENLFNSPNKTQEARKKLSDEGPKSQESPWTERGRIGFAFFATWATLNSNGDQNQALNAKR